MNDIEAMKDQIVHVLGENLICLFLGGSRGREEGMEESDYDFTAVVSKLDDEKICAMREAFANLSNTFKAISIYVLDMDDLETMPKAKFLDFMYSKKFYGDLEYSLPSKKDIKAFIDFWRRERLDRIRHYLILPHSREKINSILYPSLKRTFIYLAYLIYAETGKLPISRGELLTYLRKSKKNPLWIILMEILDNWDSWKERYSKDPLPLLLQIEKFYRTL